MRRVIPSRRRLPRLGVCAEWRIFRREGVNSSFVSEAADGDCSEDGSEAAGALTLRATRVLNFLKYCQVVIRRQGRGTEKYIVLNGLARTAFNQKIL
jgi:hypothetical protein